MPTPDPTPPPLPPECCGRCRFWTALDDVYQGETVHPMGECRFAPPVFLSAVYAASAIPLHMDTDHSTREAEIYFATRFPLTDSLEWCGRFEPAPPGADVVQLRPPAEEAA